MKALKEDTAILLRVELCRERSGLGNVDMLHASYQSLSLKPSYVIQLIPHPTCLNSEESCSMFLRNVGIGLQVYTTLHSRRPQSGGFHDFLRCLQELLLYTIPSHRRTIASDHIFLPSSTAIFPHPSAPTSLPSSDLFSMFLITVFVLLPSKQNRETHGHHKAQCPLKTRWPKEF